MSKVASVFDALSISIKCPQCSDVVEKTLSWLIDQNVMACPSCGHGIDLKAGDNGRRVQEVAREAARMAAALAKASDLS
jgi:hypothetical protein